MSQSSLVTFLAFVLVTVVVDPVISRTIRSKVKTSSDGTKQVVVDNGSRIPQSEIDFLTQDLNGHEITSALPENIKIVNLDEAVWDGSRTSATGDQEGKQVTTTRTATRLSTNRPKEMTNVKKELRILTLDNFRNLNKSGTVTPQIEFTKITAPFEDTDHYQLVRKELKIQPRGDSKLSESDTEKPIDKAAASIFTKIHTASALPSKESYFDKKELTILSLDKDKQHGTTTETSQQDKQDKEEEEEEVEEETTPVLLSRLLTTFSPSSSKGRVRGNQQQRLLLQEYKPPTTTRSTEALEQMDTMVALPSKPSTRLEVISTPPASDRDSTVTPVPDTKTSPSTSPPKKNVRKNTNEKIMMNHWNTLTEVGWKNEVLSKPVKTMYINNTRMLKFLMPTAVPGEQKEVLVPMKDIDNFPKVSPSSGENKEEGDENPKEGRALEPIERADDGEEVEEVEEEAETDLEESRGIWDVLAHLYQCVHDYSVQRGLFRCIMVRLNSMLYPYGAKSAQHQVFNEELMELADDLYMNATNAADDSMDLTAVEDDPEMHNSTVGRKSARYGSGFLVYKKILHSVLLPLLVVLVIKYLLALPFLVYGVLTMKTFWFSLLSAGLVAVANMMKKNYVVYHAPTKKLGQVQGGGAPIEVNSMGIPYFGQVPVQWQSTKHDDRLLRMIPLSDYYM